MLILTEKRFEHYIIGTPVLEHLFYSMENKAYVCMLNIISVFM
jgi:hypothetical protein